MGIKMKVEKKRVFGTWRARYNVALLAIMAAVATLRRSSRWRQEPSLNMNREPTTLLPALRARP